MPLASTPVRPVHPRLATYLSIFASAFVCLGLLLLVLEELGTSTRDITQTMVLVPVGLYVVIAGLSYAVRPHAFFAADRAIPAALNGLVIALSSFGAVGLAGVAGSLFFMGYDALALVIGVPLGLLISCTLIAPYVRKDGSYTLAGYLGRRFASRGLRIWLALALTLPVLLILVAEFKLGVTLIGRALATPETNIALVAALTTGLIAAIGGAKSNSWAGVAQALVVLIAVIVPVTTLAVQVTNLPFPQLTYGVVADDVQRLETASGLSARPATEAALSLPGTDLMPLEKPYFQAFGATGWGGFLALALTIALGLACSPALNARAGSSPSVLDVRKSLGGAIAFAVLIVLTLPAIAVFARYLVLSTLPGISVDQIPSWLDRLVQMGFASYVTPAAQLSMSNVAFSRDGVLLMLPMAAEFPLVMFLVALAGLIAAGMISASAQISALAALWTEDLIFSWGETGEHGTVRVLVARGLACVFAAVGATAAILIDSDPLELFVLGLSLAACSTFTVAVMSVWWKRINQWGAMLASASGFGAIVTAYVFIESGAMPDVLGVSGALLAPVVVALSALVAVLTSLLTGRPETRVKELLRDIRVPGGETVFDRDVRLANANRRISVPAEAKPARKR